MAQTKNKYQIIQKISDEDTLLLHPETEAEIVEYNNENSGLQADTVQGAIDEIVGGGVVTGVKGKNETDYRIGKVEITPANIGAEESGAVDAHNQSGTAHSDIRTAVSNAQSKADSAYSLAEGRAQAKGYTNYSAMITELNSLSKTAKKVGDNLYIQTKNVPDLWIYSVESTSVQYSYTSDDAFVNALKTNGSIQIGYFKVSALESEKVDLSTYQTKEDAGLTTTSKNVVGAINEVKSTASTNASNLTKVIDGTTPVAKSTSATTATTADKWKTARTLGVTVKSGKKSDNATDISATGSQSVDGSTNKTIEVELGNSGVTAGTYSAIQVNSKGIAVAGGQIVEVGTSGQTAPSSSLATGGLFFKVI